MTVRDLGLVSQVFDEQKLRALQGDMAHRPRALLDHRLVGVGERPADLALRPAPGGARAQRQPDQRRRAARRAARAGVTFRRTSDSEIIAALLSTHPRRAHRGRAGRRDAAARGRVLDRRDDQGRRGRRSAIRPGCGRCALGPGSATATASPPRAAPSTSSAPSSCARSSPARWSSLGRARHRDAPGGRSPSAGLLRVRAHLLRPPGLDPRGQPHAGVAPQDGRDPAGARRPSTPTW